MASFVFLFSNASGSYGQQKCLINVVLYVFICHNHYITLLAIMSLIKVWQDARAYGFFLLLNKVFYFFVNEKEIILLFGCALINKWKFYNCHKCYHHEKENQQHDEYNYGNYVVYLLWKWEGGYLKNHKFYDGFFFVWFVNFRRAIN
jgi:hypothetical protein